MGDQMKRRLQTEGGSAYFVAQITIHDEREYGKYLAACDRVLQKFNGEYLAVDTAPQVLEGEWSHGRIVLIRFPGEEELKKWYVSTEYQEILKFRLGGARCNSLLVHGTATNQGS
jgi:uncharacterized protein (DUF1330 family)